MLDDEKWKQNCKHDFEEFQFGPVVSEAQVHTVLEDQYFAWLYESQLHTQEVPDWKDVLLKTDYDSKFVNGEPDAQGSVIDVLLPNLEVEYDDVKKHYVIIKKTVDEAEQKVYRLSNLKFDGTSTAEVEEQASTENAFEAMRKRRVTKPRQIAKKSKRR